MTTFVDKQVKLGSWNFYREVHSTRTNLKVYYQGGWVTNEVYYFFNVFFLLHKRVLRRQKKTIKGIITIFCVQNGNLKITKCIVCNKTKRVFSSFEHLTLESNFLGGRWKEENNSLCRDGQPAPIWSRLQFDP